MSSIRNQGLCPPHQTRDPRFGAESPPQPGSAWGQGWVTPLGQVSQGKRKGKGSSGPEGRSPPSTWTGASHPEPPRAAQPHLHQLPGDPREAEPQRSAAQRPERPCAPPPPRHLHPGAAPPQVREPSDVRQAVGPVTVPWPAGAQQRSGRRLRAGITYSWSVSGCCAARPHISAGGGPAPFPAPPPLPQDRCRVRVAGRQDRPGSGP